MSIEAIKEALAAGPTEGPWKANQWTDGEAGIYGWSFSAGGYLLPLSDVETDKPEECDANAAFIAACNPVAIHSLIERLEAAEAENAQLLAGIAKCRDLIPTPKHLDAEWISAMGHPLDALAYIAAAMAGGLAEGVSDGK